MGEFRMPLLGADMEHGTILEWRVHPGDAVHRGDIVALVDTEKSDIEVEVFEDGVIEELLVGVGEEVDVGTVLARIAPAGGASPARPELPTELPAPAPAPTAVREVARVLEPVPAPPVGRGGHVRASPRARRDAAARGIDLAAVAGSGPGGAVLASDLASAAPASAPEPEAPPSAPPAPVRDRLTDQRRAVGELMSRSKRDIPHYYLASTIDLDGALRWLASQNADRPVTERLLPAVLLLKATALAARAVPLLNGTWVDGFCPADAVHLGVAVSLRGGGLVAPAIRDADTLSVDELMGELRDLVERARAGRLRSSQMSAPTLTVTNVGDQGADEVFGVIYPPQVALVGFGRILSRPWAVDGLLGVRPTVRATLAADHRASDGHDGSRFLAAIDHLLQTPEAL